MEDKESGDRSFLPKRDKLHHTRRSMLWNLFLSLALSTFFLSSSEGTTEEDFNPCNGNLAMYCQCDSTGGLWEVKDAKCWVYNRVNSEWKEIGEMTGLESVEFQTRDRQYLRSFIPSKVFSRMSNLSYFVMKHFSIERIPSYAFSNSSTVRDVILENNEIVFLDRHSFANMESLQLINLKENFILEVNRSVFSNLPRLKQLFLDRNNIRVLHDFAFSELSALEELDLKWNNLTVIARDAFANLTSVRRLELQYNSIELLGDHVFADMPNLEELELMKNKIIHVHPNAFSGLKKLGRLSLKENKIVELKHWTFASLHNLYFLDLRQNELETLEEELVAPIYTNLRNVSFQLHLEGNRFVCDCRILWIQELYNDTQSEYIQYSLKKIECNFFQRHASHPGRSRKGHGGHNNYEHSTMGSLSYISNVTMVAVAPEETTALADFDSTRNVMDLDPKEMDCQEDKVTKLVSVSTPYPPTLSSGVLDPAPSSTDFPVLIKKQKHKKLHHQGEQGEQADTPNQNPSQSSRSSAKPSSAAAGLSSRIKVNSHYFVTWLTAVAVFVMSLSLTT